MPGQATRIGPGAGIPTAGRGARLLLRRGPARWTRWTRKPQTGPDAPSRGQGGHARRSTGREAGSGRRAGPGASCSSFPIFILGRSAPAPSLLSPSGTDRDPQRSSADAGERRQVWDHSRPLQQLTRAQDPGLVPGSANPRHHRLQPNPGQTRRPGGWSRGPGTETRPQVPPGSALPLTPCLSPAGHQTSLV